MGLRRRPVRGITALVLALAAATLLGCAAGRQQHREGMSLMEQGRYEEALAKLEEAAKLGPEDLSYRSSLATARERSILRLLAAADAERTADRPEAARAAFERVLKIDAGNGRARAGLAALEADARHKAQVADAGEALRKGELDRAGALLRPVLLENPQQAGALELQRKIDAQIQKEIAVGPSLQGRFKKPVTLQFRDANLKMVFEALSRTSGINVLLDKDVRADLKTSIFVKDVSVEDTIDLILLQNQLEKKVVNENTVFVYPNTPAKLKDYQDLKIRSFHLANADPKQMLTMIKTLLKTKDIFVHEKTNSLVMRDTPDAIRLAEKLVADQDGAEPEVMLEVEVLEVSHSRLSEIGIKYPDQLTLTATGSATTGSGTSALATPTWDELRHLNGTKLITSPPLSATINLHMDHGDVNVLASPRIRARNREKAKVMIGDRVPVITNAVTPVSTGTPVVTGNVQYLDVGLKLEVEPDVNPDNLVAIKVNMEVSSISKEVQNTQSGTLAYQIGTRNASTVLRLKDGETQILAGLINDQDRKNSVEVPLLGQIPGIGRLFSTHKNDTTKTEIVLSITPHIVRAGRVPEARELEYWTGTEAALKSAPVVLKPMGSVSLSSSGGATAAAASPMMNPRFPRAQPAALAAAHEGGAMALAWQGPAQARVGERINLTLATESAPTMKSLGFQVAYDPAALRPVNAAAGNLLRPADAAALSGKGLQQADGQISVDLVGGPGETPKAGSLITLTFEVVGPAPLSLVSVAGLNSTGADGDSVAVTPPPAHTLALQPKP